MQNLIEFKGDDVKKIGFDGEKLGKINDRLKEIEERQIAIQREQEALKNESSRIALELPVLLAMKLEEEGNFWKAQYAYRSIRKDAEEKNIEGTEELKKAEERCANKLIDQVLKSGECGGWGQCEKIRQMFNSIEHKNKDEISKQLKRITADTAMKGDHKRLAAEYYVELGEIQLAQEAMEKVVDEEIEYLIEDTLSGERSGMRKKGTTEYLMFIEKIRRRVEDEKLDRLNEDTVEKMRPVMERLAKAEKVYLGEEITQDDGIEKIVQAFRDENSTPEGILVMVKNQLGIIPS